MHTYNAVMDTHSPSLEQFLETEFFKVLSEPARLRLIQLLWRLGPTDVMSLSAEMPQERSVVSRHLTALLRMGLVSVEKAGRHRRYRLESELLIVRLETLASRVKQCLRGQCGEEDSNG